MISAAVQSSARTTPGQRYLLVIYHPTMSYLTPHVRLATPIGDYFHPLTPPESEESYYWYEAGFKFVTFTAWADELMLWNTDQFTYWRLAPIAS